MAKTKLQKKEIIEEIKKLAEEQKVIVFVGIAGLKSGQIFDLREKLKERSAVLKVAKKTLVKKAFDQVKINFPEEEIKEPMGFVFGLKDEILPLKTLYQFQKENECFKILGGFLEGRFLNEKEIIEMAELPSREEILQKILWLLLSPARNFLYVIDYNLKGLLRVLQNIQK